MITWTSFKIRKSLESWGKSSETEAYKVKEMPNQGGENKHSSKTKVLSTMHFIQWSAVLTRKEAAQKWRFGSHVNRRLRRILYNWRINNKWFTRLKRQRVFSRTGWSDFKMGKIGGIYEEVYSFYNAFLKKIKDIFYLLIYMWKSKKLCL